MQTEKSGRPQAMIAMSGGVDSSVAAYLMQQAGYDCMGVTMKLYENEDAGVPRGHTCCALDDVEDARRVAYALGMPYYVFNYKDAFREQVMARFAAAYQHGATPNPCLDCNRYLKFGLLETRARALGCDVLATGHYARVEQLPDGRYTLKKAVDATKDQSYVLAWLTQEQLAHTRFPLGGLHKTEAREIAEAHGFCNAHKDQSYVLYQMTQRQLAHLLLPVGEYSKPEIRALAADFGLENAQKPDSQDICFVPDGDYAKIIAARTGKEPQPGPFLDLNGNVVGTHRGIIHYTIGQRRGLGIAAEMPLYVCGIDVPRNEVVLGRNDDLFSTELDASGCNWISGDVPDVPLRVTARIRYRQPEQPCTVTATGPDTVHVSFETPQRAITRGQAVVFYDGDTVLGGGTID